MKLGTAKPTYTLTTKVDEKLYHQLYKVCQKNSATMQDVVVHALRKTYGENK